jgi:hypothetical protein
LTQETKKVTFDEPYVRRCIRKFCSHKETRDKYFDQLEEAGFLTYKVTDKGGFYVAVDPSTVKTDIGEALNRLRLEYAKKKEEPAKEAAKQ